MTSYRVEPVSYHEARTLIATGHYLGHLRKSGTQIGVRDEDWRLVGVAVFGQPSRETVARALWLEGNNRNTVELLRFYTIDGLESWLGTWFLARAVRLLDPVVEMIVAFSDPAYGHHGGLYQAASWLYTGVTTNTPYHYEDRDGRRIAKGTPWKQAQRERAAGRAPTDETAAEGERRVARERGWARVADQRKLRYVLPRSRRARRLLRHKPQPYPKPGQREDPAMYYGTCEKCGHPVSDEALQGVAFPVTGWEVLRSQGGANAIRCRERIPERVRHAACVPAERENDQQTAMFQ